MGSTSIHERLDSLVNKSLPTTHVEQRYASYVLRLREMFLKNLEAKRADIFALEKETGGPGSTLLSLKRMA